MFETVVMDNNNSECVRLGASRQITFHSQLLILTLIFISEKNNNNT